MRKPSADGASVSRCNSGIGTRLSRPLCNTATIVSALQPKKILETGTFGGAGTLTMALNASGAEIFTVDLPDEEDGDEDSLAETRHRCACREGARALHLPVISQKIEFTRYARIH